MTFLLCFDAVHSDLNKLHRITERDSRLAHYFALFWGLGLRLDYLADVILLLSDPDFL